MCFSAGASFVASATLGAIGVATVSKTKRGKGLSLAVIPLIFAVQQFFEGLLWLSFTDEPSFVLPLTYVFLFFAFLWWPVYAPFAAYSLETQKTRKILLAGLAMLGAAVGSYLYASFLLEPGPAKILNRCLAYPSQAPYSEYAAILYVLATVGSGIFSSRMFIKVGSLLLGVSALVSWLIYNYAFTSVWCFFAALVSSIIYFYFYNGKFPKYFKRIYRKQRK